MGEFAGSWLRVSSTGQDEDNQVPDLARWIKDHDYEVRATYALHGKSASKGEQQETLDRMLSDMRAGLITVLVVWRDDRIERRGVMAMIPLINAVREAGGRIEFVTQPHLNDLTTMAGRISLAIMSEVAHAETETKKERNRMARDRIRTDGGFTGRAPWGYVITGEKYAKTIVPDEKTAPLVPEMFARVIAGESLAKVAEWLAGETKEPWWPRTVGTMIRNPVYRGMQHDAAGRVVHRCAPLVDAVTFRRAGKALDGRPKRGHVDPANRAMLSGVLFCPRCANSPMYRLNTGYYRCSGRGAHRKGCGNMAPVAAVDAAVDRIITTAFVRPVKETRIIPGNAAEVAARLEEIITEIGRLSSAGLDDAEEDRQRAELRAERDAVQSAEVVPDRVEKTETGEKYSEVWTRTPDPERGPWLAWCGARVTATRAKVRVTMDGHTAEADLA